MKKIKLNYKIKNLEIFSLKKHTQKYADVKIKTKTSCVVI